MHIPFSNVCLTGADGFVGRAVLERLAPLTPSVHALVRREPGDVEGSAGKQGVRRFVGDLGDPNDIAHAAEGCEIFIHAAARVRGPERDQAWVNVAGTENALCAARHVGCRRFVFVSCADVTLANIDRVHWNETRNLTRLPISAHGRTKALAEELVTVGGRGVMETVSLRPAWLWGPGDRTRLPSLCREGLKGGIRLVGSGDNLFATTYIEHLASAVVAAAQQPGVDGKTYYVTDGEEHTAREFFSALSEAADLPPPRRGLPLELRWALATARKALFLKRDDASEVVRRGRNSLFDCLEAITDLDYRPNVSFAQGMLALRSWLERIGGARVLADSPS